MTYMDAMVHSYSSPVVGLFPDKFDRLIELFGQGVGSGRVEGAGRSTLPFLSPLEENLRKVQDSISKVSMHLPKGFSNGLNRQFANMMDEDAWEQDDEHIGQPALNVFIQLLLATHTQRRPGIGTNGRGSITASWSVGKNRLVVECLQSEKVSMVLSREMENGDIERAAFGAVHPRRAREILAPFNPGVWFDG